jgi:uncharacterized membrane protein
MKRAPAAIAVSWPVAALATAGLAISLYLTLTKLAGATALLCRPGGGCDVVQSSSYATFLGLPTAAWGVGLYVVVGALALAGLTARRWLWVFVLAVVGASFSAFLTFVELAILHAVCFYCLTAALVALALLAVVLAQRPHSTERRGWGTRRLATLGASAAALTLVLGVVADLTGGAVPATAYQEGLARHLAQTGAVFYGAYW